MERRPRAFRPAGGREPIGFRFACHDCVGSASSAMGVVMSASGFDVVLCLVDSSDISADALRKAAALATCTSGKLVVLYANWPDVRPCFAHRRRSLRSQPGCFAIPLSLAPRCGGSSAARSSARRPCALSATRRVRFCLSAARATFCRRGIPCRWNAATAGHAGRNSQGGKNPPH